MMDGSLPARQHFPRAKHWRLRTRVLQCGDRPLLMGIVNVTPDSFSDGGRFRRLPQQPDHPAADGTSATSKTSAQGRTAADSINPASAPFSSLVDHQAAIQYGLKLVADGADLLDVGGESTRPGAEPVSAEEELRRVLPVVAALCQQAGVPVSIDTYKAQVARAAIDAGAEIINDVTALTADPEMAPLAASSRCGVCVMHMQGTPQTMQIAPSYTDVLAEVMQFLADRRDRLLAAGIEQDRIAVDPGIGFGKTCQHNLTLLAGAWRFHALGCPVVVGPSRKRFIGEVLGDMSADRTAGTIGVALALAQQGVQVLRVHDVAAVGQALRLWQAAGGAL